MELEKRPDGRIACPFDHHAPEFAENYREVFDELRSKAPIAWSDKYGGFWIASSHKLVRQLQRDDEHFIVGDGLQIPTRPANLRAHFVPGEADGDDHDRYRLALNPMFSKAKVATMEPMIRKHVTRTLDEIVDRAEFEAVREFMQPILARVGCEHLGLDVEDPPRFIREVESFVSYSGESSEMESLLSTFDGAWAVILETIHRRRSNPGDDVISYLIQLPGEDFTDHEIQMMTLNVILGAAASTANLVSQIMMYLDTHPDLRHQLSTQPEIIPEAMDEFIRLLPPNVHGVARTATSDVEVAGVTIRQGDRLLLARYGANHDPEQYQNPYEFDLDRGARLHVGMGIGAHFCLGAWLAKGIASVAVSEVLRRIPDFRVDVERAVRDPNRSLLSWKTLPVLTHGRVAAH